MKPTFRGLASGLGKQLALRHKPRSAAARLGRAEAVSEARGISVTADSTLLTYLQSMCRIRYFEDEVTRLKSDGMVAGSVHLCSGQEAIYVGACTALDLPRDAVFCTYRGHGWAIACGVPLVDLFGELLGRETGVNGGRGGSAYLSSPRHGMYGENSIVGAGAPIAAGAALAATFDRSNRVVLTAFGDGAMNQGSVHEAMNFAAVYTLPVLFLIENNHWSELTPIASMVRSDRLFKRASSYGIPGVRIDGNDVAAVRDTVAEAAAHARKGGGPVVIEAMTQRIVGHYIGDAQQYRTAEEIDRAREAEPIAQLSQLLRESTLSPAEVDIAMRAVHAEVREAAAEAERAPLADPTTVLEHLYA
ncbi:thiamine pyrophosphate-dependent dehydrogenase E1 component subunit alpha [Dactylosporangium sp. CA-233914]|uniref:thiamine pyrophosphate-dependent dehydrogenase E1 component subunit alpha n=1 Tax=Dactylosporangium sp. CA-233914 TaxID=3239934 RepID=UPI003D903DBF